VFVVNDKIIAWFIVIITLISIVPANALYPAIPLSSNENALPFTFTNQTAGNNSTLVNQSTINSTKSDDSNNINNNSFYNYQTSNYYNDSYNYVIDSNASSNSDNYLYIDSVNDNHDDHGIINISTNSPDKNNNSYSDNSGYSDNNISTDINYNNKSRTVNNNKELATNDNNNYYSVNDTFTDINYNDHSDINYTNRSKISNDDKEPAINDNNNYYSVNDTPTDINYNNHSDINYTNRSKISNDDKEPATNDNDNHYSDGDPNIDLPDFSLNNPCTDITGLRFFDNNFAKLNSDINIDSLLSSYTLTDGYYYINGQGHTIYFNDLSLFLRVYKNSMVVFENVNFVATGGSLIHNYGTVVCVNCTFTGFNSKHDNGCVFYNDGGILILVNNVFKNNISKSGGVIYNTDNGVVYIQNCIFDGNSGTVDGGAIYSDAGFIGIIGSVFENNKAINGGAISFVNSCIWTSNSIIYIIDKTFFDIFDNIITYLSCGSPSYTSHIFNSNVFDNNKADYGGAVLGNVNTFLFLDNTSFINNKSVLGGAIYSTCNSLVYIFNSLFKNNSAFKGGSLYLDGNYDFNIYNTVFTNNIDSFIYDNIFGMSLYAVLGPGKIFRDNIDITNTLFNDVIIEYLNDIIPGFVQGLMVTGFIALGVTLIALGSLLITLSVVAAALSFISFGLTAPLAIALGILGLMLIGIGVSLITSAVVGLSSGSLDHSTDIDGKWNNWLQVLVFGCLLSAIIAVTLLSIFLPPVAGVGLAALTVSSLGIGAGVMGTITSFIVSAVVGAIESIPMVILMVLSDVCGPYLHVGLSKALFFSIFIGSIITMLVNPLLVMQSIEALGLGVKILLVSNILVAVTCLTLLISATVSNNPIYSRVLFYMVAFCGLISGGINSILAIRSKAIELISSIRSAVSSGWFTLEDGIIKAAGDGIIPKYLINGAGIIAGTIGIDYYFNHNNTRMGYAIMVLMGAFHQGVESYKVNDNTMVRYVRVTDTAYNNETVPFTDGYHLIGDLELEDLDIPAVINLNHVDEDIEVFNESVDLIDEEHVDLIDEEHVDLIDEEHVDLIDEEHVDLIDKEHVDLIDEEHVDLIDENVPQFNIVKIPLRDNPAWDQIDHEIIPQLNNRVTINDFVHTFGPIFNMSREILTSMRAKRLRQPKIDYTNEDVRDLNYIHKFKTLFSKIPDLTPMINDLSFNDEENSLLNFVNNKQKKNNSSHKIPNKKNNSSHKIPNKKNNSTHEVLKKVNKDDPKYILPEEKNNSSFWNFKTEQMLRIINNNVLTAEDEFDLEEIITIFNVNNHSLPEFAIDPIKESEVVDPDSYRRRTLTSRLDLIGAEDKRLYLLGATIPLFKRYVRDMIRLTDLGLNHNLDLGKKITICGITMNAYSWFLFLNTAHIDANFCFTNNSISISFYDINMGLKDHYYSVYILKEVVEQWGMNDRIRLAREFMIKNNLESATYNDIYNYIAHKFYAEHPKSHNIAYTENEIQACIKYNITKLMNTFNFNEIRNKTVNFNDLQLISLPKFIKQGNIFIHEFDTSFLFDHDDPRIPILSIMFDGHTIANIREFNLLPENINYDAFKTASLAELLESHPDIPRRDIILQHNKGEEGIILLADLDPLYDFDGVKIDSNNDLNTLCRDVDMDHLSSEYLKSFLKSVVFIKRIVLDNSIFKTNYIDMNDIIIVGNVKFRVRELFEYIINSNVFMDGHYHPVKGSKFPILPVSAVLKTMKENFFILEGSEINVVNKILNKDYFSFPGPYTRSNMLLINRKNKFGLTCRSLFAKKNYGLLPKLLDENPENFSIIKPITILDICNENKITHKMFNMIFNSSHRKSLENFMGYNKSRYISITQLRTPVHNGMYSFKKLNQIMKLKPFKRNEARISALSRDARNEREGIYGQFDLASGMLREFKKTCAQSLDLLSRNYFLNIDFSRKIIIDNNSKSVFEWFNFIVNAEVKSDFVFSFDNLDVSFFQIQIVFNKEFFYLQGMGEIQAIENDGFKLHTFNSRINFAREYIRIMNGETIPDSYINSITDLMKNESPITYRVVIHNLIILYISNRLDSHGIYEGMTRAKAIRKCTKDFFVNCDSSGVNHLDDIVIFDDLRAIDTPPIIRSDGEDQYAFKYTGFYDTNSPVMPLIECGFKGSRPCGTRQTFIKIDDFSHTSLLDYYGELGIDPVSFFKDMFTVKYDYIVIDINPKNIYFGAKTDIRNLDSFINTYIKMDPENAIYKRTRTLHPQMHTLDSATFINFYFTVIELRNEVIDYRCASKTYLDFTRKVPILGKAYSIDDLFNYIITSKVSAIDGFYHPTKVSEIPPLPVTTVIDIMAHNFCKIIIEPAINLKKINNILFKLNYKSLRFNRDVTNGGFSVLLHPDDPLVKVINFNKEHNERIISRVEASSRFTTFVDIKPSCMRKMAKNINISHDIFDEFLNIFTPFSSNIPIKDPNTSIVNKYPTPIRSLEQK
jgi:predicted outer membrane repeat protein